MIAQLDLLRDGRFETHAVGPIRPALKVAGLFAGIAGVELGMGVSGHHPAFFSELDPAARAVLEEHFPTVPIIPDVHDVQDLNGIDLVAAGFPCQDLSQAGRTAGISGAKSGLVAEVLRLMSNNDPQWLLLENVPFMLSLDRGRAMLHLTTWLTQLGFNWAYRIVDTRAFGLPQRRQRVLLLASRSHDPRNVLLADNSLPRVDSADGEPAFGFYWTEGNRGLGWARDAVPTLKAGSTVGIPSPPGVWVPELGQIGTPDIRDAERLQGFPVDWTAPAAKARHKRGLRWRLVGNAVSVPVTKWLGERLRGPGSYDVSLDSPAEPAEKWPKAAWSCGGKIYASAVSMWPVAVQAPPLMRFLQYPLHPLSRKATAGFFQRASKSTLRFEAGFLAAIEQHLHYMEQKAANG